MELSFGVTINEGLKLLSNVLLENANGELPLLEYLLTLGLKSIVSEALKSFFRWGISFPYLSASYEATV